VECKRWDWSKLQNPNLEMVEYILSKLKSTAPGVSGISSMAWKHGSKDLAVYILDLVDAMCEGTRLPDDFKHSLSVFLRKGGEDAAQGILPEVVFVRPLETRPLSLKQGDNKHAASTLNFCISPSVSHGAIDTQRGFIHGRQLVQNVLDLDFHLRAMAFGFRQDHSVHSPGTIEVPTIGIAATIPLGVLYDFASAFPSVGHEWLLLVMEAIKIWRAFLCAIKCLYADNHAYADDGGMIIYLFPILSGILQGCPLSGTLFVFVVDPLLWMFRKQINSAIIRACADDIGAALRRLDDLVALYNIFKKFQAVSGLVLKPSKCVIILTVCQCTPQILENIRGWLEIHIPEWRGMKIQACAKYLGFFLGPAAGSVQWNGPMAKFRKRTEEIKRNGGPLSLAVRQFNVRACTVLGYVSQLVPPPRNIIREELSGILQALRLAGNSMDANCAFKLKAWLGLDPVRPSIYMAVCMLRAALKTLAEFDTMHIELKNLSFECLSFALGSKTIIPPGWDSEAFCTNLYKARRLENNNQIWQARAQIHNIICEWRAGRGSKAIQKRLYQCLLESSHDPWPKHIEYKVGKVLLVNTNPDFSLSALNYLELMQDLGKVPAWCKTCFFKTLINSWATSHRYGESILLPCIFGCTGKTDDLEHYLCCDPMWTCAVSAASLPPSFLSLSPIERLCMVNRRPESIKLLGVAFRGYHSMRLGFRYVIDRCIANSDFAEVILLFSRLCSEAWLN